MGYVALTNYKKSSERCKNKHHKEFYNGKTLVEIKIDQLLNAGAEHVYVSTNDKDVENTEHVSFVYREEQYCNNVTQFSEVLQEIYNTVPIDDNTDTLYTFTCCPLFSRYDEMYDEYLRTGKNQIAVYPSYHYWLDINKRPVNFNFGLWHTYSQGIDPIFMFPYCGQLAKMKDFRKVNYTIPQEFDYFYVNSFESIDIDTQDEFEMAQHIYGKKFKDN